MSASAQASEGPRLLQMPATDHILRVDLAAMSQVQLLVNRSSVPRDGHSEAIGILTGTVASPREIDIDGVIDISGPSPVVSEDEVFRYGTVARERLQELIPGNEARLIGLVRSHTRNNSVAIDEDKALLADLLPDAALIWIVQPADVLQSRCRVYVRQSRKKWLEAGEISLPALSVAGPGSTAPDGYERTQRSYLKWLLPAAACFGLMAGYGIWQRTRPPKPIAHPARPAVVRLPGAFSRSSSVIPSLPDHSDPLLTPSGTLGLHVMRWNTGLRVTWTVTAPEIRSAPSGRLLILDGATEGVVNLNAAQLQSGSILYTGREDVIFRLELPGGEAESVSLSGGNTPNFDSRDSISGSVSPPLR